MYERQYNWTPLCPSDPIPGSPDVLDRNAALFRTSASNVGSAITNLARLDCRDENYSEAILKIMEKADSVAASLTLVKSRYEAMEQALTHYAPRLRQAQATSLTALNNATEAARRKNEAWGRIWEAKPRTLSPDTAVRDQAVYEYNRAVSDFGHAKGDIADAKALLAQAIGVRNTAGDTAAGIVREALKDSPLNDDIWDHVGQALATIGKAIKIGAQWIWDNIDKISLVLDIVSLILLATGVGAPAGAFLLAVTKVARVVSIASKVAKGVSLLKEGYDFYSSLGAAQRTGNWSGVVSSGAELAVSLAFFGGGLAVKSTTKAAFAPGFAKATAAANSSATLQTLSTLSKGSGKAGEILGALRASDALRDTAHRMTPELMADGVEAGVSLSLDSAKEIVFDANGLNQSAAGSEKRPAIVPTDPCAARRVEVTVP